MYCAWALKAMHVLKRSCPLISRRICETTFYNHRSVIVNFCDCEILWTSHDISALQHPVHCSSILMGDCYASRPAFRIEEEIRTMRALVGQTSPLPLQWPIFPLTHLSPWLSATSPSHWHRYLISALQKEAGPAQLRGFLTFLSTAPTINT